MPYRYRNLPCNVVPEQDLWFVGGMDAKDKSAGILEWCVSESDAKERMSLMSQDPRFSNLSFGQYIHDTYGA